KVQWTSGGVYHVYAGGGPNSVVYVRETAGSPTVNLTQTQYVQQHVVAPINQNAQNGIPNTITTPAAVTAPPATAPSPPPSTSSPATVNHDINLDMEGSSMSAQHEAERQAHAAADRAR